MAMHDNAFAQRLALVLGSEVGVGQGVAVAIEKLN